MKRGTGDFVNRGEERGMEKDDGEQLEFLNRLQAVIESHYYHVIRWPVPH